MSDTPFVSILCPTRDRREFLPRLLAYVQRQTWPADRRELVIVDDGRDAVGDLVEGLPGVVYEHVGDRIALGTKRNRTVELAQGEILVHMDDDDWYPPDRVEKAVAHLQATGADLVGTSRLAFWDVGTRAVHVMPFIGPKHAHAGTMAYRRSYWEGRKWEPDPHGEERQFTNCWDAKLEQLPGEPWETVLCISHGGNTLPKNPRHPKADVTLADIVADPADRAFYEGLDDDDW